MPLGAWRFIFLILPVIFLAVQNPRFLSVRNIFNILTDVSIYGVMAVGMTLGSTSR